MSLRRPGLALRELSPVLLAAGLAVLLLWSPVPWPCALRSLTGLPCPTCGMTRAARFALHGRFAEATTMHPLWFIVLPALVALVAGETIAFLRAGRWGTVIENRWTVRVGVAVVLALLVVWIARFCGAFGGPAPA